MTIRDNKQFAKGMETVMQVKEILINPQYSAFIDSNDNYYEFVVSLKDYINGKEGYVKEEEQLDYLLNLLIDIDKGESGDFDDFE